jgi:hypothetical protein
MKWNSGEHTHPQYAVPPEQFRAQATGVGVTRACSAITGSLRAQRVVECMSPKTREQVPPAEGYPPPMVDEYGCVPGSRVKGY